MFKSRIIQIFVATFIVLSFVACSKNTPEAAAEQFLTGLYHMEYDKARAVSTDDTKGLIDLVEQFSVSTADSARKEAKNIKIEITEVKVDGDNAVVKYKMSSEPGEQKLDMVKQNGKWLASFSKQDNIPEMEADEDVMEDEPEEASESAE
ncbi:MAG: DUF4878 domain-containing protein [Chitinophagales bacterium]|nr:DUF4878 domain-containing protein [Chitinophagaceae bacterium]MCB9063824.1 DUF4878 domain-containing protein [Chitinophagales bacterium]